MLMVRPGLSSKLCQLPAAPFRCTATLANVLSPSLRVALAYLRGSRRSESASFLSKTNSRVMTLPFLKKASRSSDDFDLPGGAALAGTRAKAGTARNSSNRSMSHLRTRSAEVETATLLKLFEERQNRG